MRKIQTFIILLTFQVFSVFPQDSVVVTTFSLSYNNNIIKLIIEYNMNYTGTLEIKDTTKNKSVFEKFFGGAKIPQEKNVFTVNDVKNELIQIISNNSSLKLEPEFPKDVLQIIDLIKGKRKKEEAKQIYIKNNPEKLISIDERTNLTAQNGNYTKTYIISYTCLFRIEKKTSLNIPGFHILYDSKTFQTKPITISL